MSAKRGDEGAAAAGGGGAFTAEALARELADRLEALATPVPAVSHPPKAPGRPAFSLAGPRILLEQGLAHVSPSVPAGARFGAVKSLLLRALRIVTRDQTTFNSALAEALRSALTEVEAALSELKSDGRRTREELEGALKAVEAGERRLQETSSALESSLAAVLAELRDEEAAREAVAKAADARVGELGQRLDGEVLSRRSALAEQGGDLARVREELRHVRAEWSVLRAGLTEERGPRWGATPAVAAPSAAAEMSAAAPSAAAAMNAAAPSAAAADDPLRGGVYVGFEHAFRGSEAEIRKRQEEDVALFAGAPGPIADLGCGRGEMLEALRAAGLAAHGCDANAVMVELAREKGLEVAHADLFSWLRAQADASLGGITAYQVVEHLPAASLFPLVELCLAKLAGGGRVLLETINPESVYAMRWFWMDLSHTRPVPAPSLSHLLSSCGFRDVRVLWRSPVPETEALPREAASREELAPIARLLFGPQDYAVTGVK